jgi:hypothetical protein
MKLTYQDALELKEAGFPQEQKKGHYIFPNETYRSENGDGSVHHDEDKCYQATLEELIEACGEEIVGMQRRLDGGWYVIANPFTAIENVPLAGDSLIQAVKKLYCALNPKRQVFHSGITEYTVGEQLEWKDSELNKK